MVRRRGVHLLVAAVLCLAFWAVAGSGGAITEAGEGPGDDQALVTSRATGLRAHTALVRTPHDRTPVARAQRLVALATVLVGAGLVARASRLDRSRLDDLPVWSGWFAHPGLLRGPPTT